MNALIDLEHCRESMTISLNGVDHTVRLAGTIENPYFCGKDVCDVLGYKDSKDALKKFTEEEDKFHLEDLMVESHHTLGGANCPPQRVVESDHTLGKNQYSFREGQIIYINETGLYSLILSSKAPFAKEFRKLVCKIILPSIRRYGSYQAEARLSETMAQLAIRDKSNEELKEQLIKAERKAIRVNKFMRRVSIKENKLEWIYIATTQLYAQERLFKIGSTTRLSSRIGGYNTGRPREDNYYYCWVIKCYNAKDIDYHIQRLLSDFKHREKAELYCGIKFSDLKAIVTFIVENYDKSVDYINNFVRSRLDASLIEEDVPPPRLDFKKFTYQIGDHTETIDFENEEIDSVREAFDEILTSIKEQRENLDDLVIVHRRELMSRLSGKINLPKNGLWGQVKQYTGWTCSKDELLPPGCGDFKYKIIYN